ncbi:hypothetical protein DY000_02007663 [Brassica cretica]|uniref:Uncharacterized protein n=1 Tax=Brassica cretica TaxID=69181 RepID=A0ABQ7BU38_BRACR|nr:hypothetical protein DY000_02007663 [Brassica cretica]
MGGHQTRTFVLAWKILSSNLIETASRIGERYSYRDCIEDGQKYEARDSYLMGKFVEWSTWRPSVSDRYEMPEHVIILRYIMAGERERL